MNSKKHSNEAFDISDDWQQDSYRTGSTQPPKSHGGLIAFLLGLVIFLCGIITALGLMNVKLQWQLDNQAQDNLNPIAFSRSAAEEAAPCQSPLGFTGRDVTPFWNEYRNLPQGIYITEVDGASDAAKKGVSTRDILLSINSTRITDSSDLDAFLSTCQSGQTVALGLYRDGRHLSITVTLG